MEKTQIPFQKKEAHQPMKKPILQLQPQENTMHTVNSQAQNINKDKIFF